MGRSSWDEGGRRGMESKAVVYDGHGASRLLITANQNS